MNHWVQKGNYSNTPPPPPFSENHQQKFTGLRLIYYHYSKLGTGENYGTVSIFILFSFFKFYEYVCDFYVF